MKMTAGYFKKGQHQIVFTIEDITFDILKMFNILGYEQIKYLQLEDVYIEYPYAVKELIQENFFDDFLLENPRDLTFEKEELIEYHSSKINDEIVMRQISFEVSLSDLEEKRLIAALDHAGYQLCTHYKVVTGFGDYTEIHPTSKKEGREIFASYKEAEQYSAKYALCKASYRCTCLNDPNCPDCGGAGWY